jgi:hypothetical protein
MRHHLSLIRAYLADGEIRKKQWTTFDWPKQKLMIHCFSIMAVHTTAYYIIKIRIGSGCMAKSSNLYIRIELEVKEQAEKVFECLEFLTSNAVGLFSPYP